MRAFSGSFSGIFKGGVFALSLFAANCSGRTYNTFFQPFDLIFGSQGNSSVNTSLLSATPLTNTRVMLTFSKPVTLESGQLVANYRLEDPNGNLLQILAASRDPNNSRVIFIDTLPQTAGTTYTITASNIMGVDGSSLGNNNRATFTAPNNADQTGPQFSSVAALNATTVEVYFNEAISQTVSNATFGGYFDIYTSNDCTTGNVNVTSAARDASNYAKVTLTSAAMTPGTTYYVCATTSVRDIWGNANSATIASGSFVYSAPTPQVVSAVSSSPTSLLVTFDQAMANTPALTTNTNYTFTGCGSLSAGSATVTPIGTSQVLLTNLTAGSSGTCRVTVNTAITSALGAALTSSTNSALFTYTNSASSDTTAPAVLSVTTTNSTTIQVIFSETVSGVSTADFSLSPALNISAVSCTGNVCTLTTAEQSTTSYSLSVTNNDGGIQDTASPANTLNSGSTAFTGDGRPYIVAIYPVDQNTVLVEWSEPIGNAASVDVADYTINTATITAAALEPSGSDPSKFVKLTISPALTAGTSYALSVNNPTGSTDAAGNATLSTVPNGGAFTGPASTQAPQVTGGSSPAPTVLLINFNEPLNNATIQPTDFALSGACSGLTINTATQIQAGVVQLILAAGAAGSGSCTVTVGAGNVSDLAGNAIAGTNNSATFNYTGTGTADTTPPSVASVVALSSTQVRVYFSEPVDTTTGQTVANYVFSPTLNSGSGSANPSSVTCSGTFCTLNLVAPNITSAVQYTLTVSNVQDTATPTANTMSTQSVQFSGIGSSASQPTLYQAVLINATTLELSFSEQMDLTSSQNTANYAVTGSGTVTVFSAVRQSDTTKVRLSLSPGAYGSSNTYTVTVTGVTDTSGNSMGTPNSATFSGSANAPATTTLAAVSDTGTVGDNVTGAAFPSPGLQFTGTVSPNTVVYLYDDGVLVATATSNGSGAYTVTLASGTTVSQGTNVFRIATVGPTGQLSDLSPPLSITYDSIAPSAPTGLDLVTASDTGISSTDNITNSTTPQFTVACENGASVQLYTDNPAAGTATGSAVTCSGGTATLTAATLAVGAHNITVRQTDVAGNVSVVSGSLAATIDTTAPGHSSSNLAPSNTTLTITLSEGAYNASGVALTTADFSLAFAANGGTATGASITGITHTAGSATVVLTIAVTGTVAGTETITVSSVANAIQDAAGNWANFNTGAKLLNAVGVANMITASTTYTATSATTGYLFIEWDEAAYTNTGMSGGLTAGDFTLTFTQNSGNATGASIACVTNTASTSCPGTAPAAGATQMRVHLTISGAPSGVETVRLNAGTNQIFSATDAATPDTDNSGTITLPDLLAPTVTNVTSSTANGSYKAGDVIAVQVVFSEVVNVTGTPQITLETGTTDAVVNYSSGSGTNTLVFNYTIASGHTSSDLDYVSTTALALNGGTIRDAANNNATLTLASPGAAGSLGANKNLVVDTTAPTVTNVTSSTANGSYKAGDVIAIEVVFSEAVTVTGTPQITLETGTTDAVVDYASGSGTNTLVFNYTIAAGHTSSDLDYVSTTALALNGGTIRDAASNNATLTLASPGAAGSLGANKNLVVDTTAPTVTNVTASTADGTYGIGQTINVQVVFSESVTVTGTPQITLETGTTDAVVDYASGSGTNTLVFTYTIAAGHNSTDLDYVSTTALALNGGTIRDAASNNATLTLATPGAANSLGANKALVVDGVVPTVTNVTASTADGSYGVGQTINVQVVFSENVTVTGTPQITLETGTTDAVVNYSSGSGTNTLVFTYTIAAGHNSTDLDYVSTTALALNGGTIRDTANNNATLTLASPGAAGSLAANKALVVDGVAPTLTAAETLDADNDGKIDTYKLTFSESVKDDTFPGYSANALGTVTSHWLVAGFTNVRLIHGTAVTFATDTVNDNVLYIRFDENVLTCNVSSQVGCDTDAKPDLTTSATPGLTDLATTALAQVNTAAVTEADTALPILVAAKPTGGTSVDAIFSEPVNTTQANVAANYTITGSGGLTVSAANRDSSNTHIVHLTTSSQTNGASYTLTVNTTVRDLVNNNLAATANTANFTGTNLPVVVSATTSNATTLTLTFDQTIVASSIECANAGACASKFETANGGIPVITAVSTAGSGVNSATFTITVNTMVEGASYLIEVKPGTATSVGTGFTIGSSNNTANFTGDGPPGATISPDTATACPANGPARRVVVQYDQTVSATALTTTNYKITGCLTGDCASGTGAPNSAGASSVTNLGGNKYAVDFTNNFDTDSSQYQLTITGVQDSTGNTILPPGNFSFQCGTDTTAPVLVAATVTSATAGSTVVLLTFSEAVTSTTANVAGNYKFDSNAYGYNVNNAVIQSNPAQVQVTFQPAIPNGGHFVRVRNVQDLVSNTIVDNGVTNIQPILVNAPTGFSGGSVFDDPFGDGTPAGTIVIYDQKLYLGPDVGSAKLFEINYSLTNAQTITLDADGTFGAPVSSFNGFLTKYTGCSTPPHPAFSNPPLPTDQCTTGTTDERDVEGVDNIYAACVGGTSTPNLTGSACTSAGGTEALFMLARNTDVTTNAYYRSFWRTTDKSSSTTTFTFTEGYSGDTGGTAAFRAMNTIVFKDQLYVNFGAELGGGGRGGRVCINPSGCPGIGNSTYLAYVGFARWSKIRRIGVNSSNTLRNGSYNGAGAPYADANVMNQAFNAINTMYEYDNDGAGSNESQLYIANGGYSNSALGSARTGNTDGGIMRTVLAYSSKTSQPLDCPTDPDASGCSTYWEDVTPDTKTKWNSYYSIPYPQNTAATSSSNCSTSYIEMDCVQPFNIFVPALKAIPYMRRAPNGDLYLIRNACSTNNYATNGGSNNFRTLRQVCPSGSEVPQLWMMPANCGSASSCANAWVLVAEYGTTGKTNMAGNTGTCGTSPNKCLTNTHITLLEMVGNWMYIGYDNGTHGTNIWRVNMSSVTSGTTPAESSFQRVNIEGLDGTSTNQKLFSHVTYTDAGQDWLVVTTRDGSNAMRIYRTGNGFN